MQAAYNADQGTVLAEGTAVWSTEQFDSSLNDFEGFIGGYLDNVDRSLDRPGTGPVDSFSYGAAIFFQFLGEKLGVDVIRGLYEDCVLGARGVEMPAWFSVLPTLLVRDHATTFADVFTEFATYNLFTAVRADASRGYAHGAGYQLAASTKASLPYEDTTLRVFYASSQILLFEVAGRAQLSAAVVPTTSTDDSALRILVAPMQNGLIAKVSTSDGSSPIELGAATQVLVEVVSTAQSGDSIKGTLCVGTPSEVAACQAKNGGTPPRVMSPGGGCTTAGTRPRASGPGAILLLALAFCLRRRPGSTGDDTRQRGGPRRTMHPVISGG